jgi:formylglycine-generating enzyme required for sulfatase activity
MSEAVQQQLHQLATAYAAGELHQSAYRARRAHLLDELVGLPPLSDALESTRPRVIAPAAAPSPPAAKASPAIPEPTVPSASTAGAQAGGRSGLLVGIVLLVVLGGGVALWWFSRATPGAGASPSAGRPAAGAATDAAVDPATLVAGFLAQNDWSDAALSRFNASWWRLSDAQVATILTAPGTQPMRDAIAALLRDRAALDPSAPIVLLAHNLNVEIPAGAVSGYAAEARRNAPGTTEASGAAATSVATSPAKSSGASAPGAVSPTGPAARTPAAAAAAPKPTPAATATAAGAANGTAASTTAPPATADPCRNARRGLCHDTLPGGVEAPKLVVIAAGAFAMGSTAHPEEQPVHQVTIARSFAVTINEISDAEYRVYCSQPGHECPKQPWDGERRPVVNVSWDDAVDYAKWLSQATGQRYRLPTEAEWEYFARAGTKGDYWSDKPLDLSQAYFASAAAAPTAPAELSQGGYSANPWGLLHVAGNVREWVADAWAPTYDSAPADGSARTEAGELRVVRGGSYHDPLPKLRSAARDKLDAQTRDAFTGIRLVRELAP